MSITSDIRTYADTALEQGKTVLGQAQKQVNDVTDTANVFVGKLTDTALGNVSSVSGKANDLRSQAEKALNIDSVIAAVEPYLEQAKQYRHTISSTLSDRAETLYDTVKSDQRVAKVIDSAGSISTFVIDTVNERLVKPALTLTGRGPKPAPKKKPAAKASRPATKASKPATTRPAAKKAVNTAANKPANKAVNKAVNKAPVSKSTTAAKKSPAKKATATTS